MPIKKLKSRKPPYRVPTMAEIRTAEADHDAYARRPVVASTFAGGGGSSLGWRMAGFRVAWANEFDERQALAYRLNMNPATALDVRDVRDVDPRDVAAACGASPGELDVLDGSPPCQTFSTAGKRDMSDAQSDLFMEFTRLLRGLQPRTFVAENVSGLVKGVAKGYFKMILAELKRCGYRVAARVLDAQWLGVPQVRKRVIFVGIRNDLGVDPAFPRPLRHRYSVTDACPQLLRQAWSKGQFSKSKGARQGEYRQCSQNPSPTIGTGPFSGDGLFPPSVVYDENEKRKFTIAELKRICSFPDDYDMGELSYAKRWAVMGNAVPPLMMRAIAEVVRDEILARQHPAKPAARRIK